MANLKKGKAVRVKANVAQTTAYDFADSSIANVIRYFKAGEEIGTITNESTFDGGDGVEYVEILLKEVSYTGIEQFDVNLVYVALSDIDVIAEDVDDNDTIVYDRNGNLLEGSAYDYPDAIPTGQTKNGKRVFFVKSLPKDGGLIIGEPINRPQWLIFGLWVLVGTGVVTFVVVIYKALSK
jgi:hypothetical protein